MVYLTVKDKLSVVLLWISIFYAPNFGVHHDLIGLLSLLYVRGFMDRDGVSNVKVVEIPHACYVDGFISQTMFYCFL